MSQAVEHTLLLECHRAIDECVDATMGFIASQSLSYPPGVELTDEERAVLSALDLYGPSGSAMRKVLS